MTPVPEQLNISDGPDKKSNFLKLHTSKITNAPRKTRFKNIIVTSHLVYLVKLSEILLKKNQDHPFFLRQAEWLR